MSMSVTLSARGGGGGGGGTVCVQDASYMDTDFILLAHKGSEIWTSQSLRFTQAGLLQLQHK